MADRFASWASVGAAKAAWRAVEHQIAACHQVSANDHGTPVKFQIEPMNLPRVGAMSAAFEVDATIKGTTVLYALDLVQKGRAVVNYVYADVAHLNVPQLVNLLRLAVDDVRG